MSPASGTMNNEQSGDVLMMERPSGKYNNPQKKEPRLRNDTDDQSEWRGHVINTSLVNCRQRGPSAKRNQRSALQCVVECADAWADREGRRADGRPVAEQTAPSRNRVVNRPVCFWTSC